MSLTFYANDDVQAWSRLGRRHHAVAAPRFSSDVVEWAKADCGQRLAIGARRSYSDVGLLDDGRLLDMTGVSRFHEFDPETGLLAADAGVTLAQILDNFVPRGFFLPVTPGTRLATLGGAIANDVHGKNHMRAGTFGCHVERITLLRSDRGLVELSRLAEPELFDATIGGLGLTGIIVDATIRLQPIASAWLDVETVPCRDFDSLVETLVDREARYENSVAWIDCAGRGRSLGRGLVTAADWCADGCLTPAPLEAGLGVPTDRVGKLLNPLSVRAFNSAYFHMGARKAGVRRTHFAPFFYPLDKIAAWNRLYGAGGFYQYQCVIPAAAGVERVRRLVEIISASGDGSFLAVLKSFGNRSSPGLLSFPMPGLSLALDFRNMGEKTMALFAQLDLVVQAAGGRLYAAKDARLPTDFFAASYPKLAQYRASLDPACHSDFAKRMGLK